MQKDKKQRSKRNEPREAKEEFEQAILDLARVTRVMAGGKRMRFRATVAIGDRAGRVGIGIAKGADVQIAISKAVNDAKKNVIKVKITQTGTIPHEVKIRMHSSHLFLKPAPSGTGIIAGSVVRQIFELAGISDIVGKIMGTGNKINNAKAVIEALSRLRDPKGPIKTTSVPPDFNAEKKRPKEAEEPKKKDIKPEIKP